MTRSLAFASPCTAFFLAILLLAPVSPAEARPKKLGQQAANCRCSCFEDASVQGPKQRITIEFYDNAGNTHCGANNGGGCRIQQADGTYKPGTARNCRGIFRNDTAIQGGNNSSGAPVNSAD